MMRSIEDLDAVNESLDQSHTLEMESKTIENEGSDDGNEENSVRNEI